MSSFLRLGEPPRIKPPSSLSSHGSTMSFADAPTKIVASHERLNNRELDVLPTSEMRKLLRSKGVHLATDKDLLDYSLKLNAWVDAWRYEQRLPPSISWYNLFKFFDRDGSDFITFDEFVTCVRRELKKGPTVISHNELMSLWCALDISGDNMVSRDEASGFFKLGQSKKSGSELRLQAKPSTPRPSAQRLNSTIERHGMTGAIPARPTSVMLEELKQDGLPLLDEEELNNLAKRLTRWIESWRYDQNLPPSVSWYNLFKELDADNSGFVTFDELLTCVRRELKKGPKRIPHSVLKQLWCALDKNCDDQLDKEEMGAFFARGAEVLKQTKGKGGSWWNPFKGPQQVKPHHLRDSRGY